MNMFSQLTWCDSRNKIWGFHIHQELPCEEFAKALVIQEKCAEFLKKQDISIDANDVIKPGYGPHLEYMWELRIEKSRKKILEKLGLAISYMAINRFGLSAYIHPLMHDPHLPEHAALELEGVENQANTLWFGYKVRQNQDFFFNPPKDQHDKIIDTRTSRVMTKNEKDDLIVVGRENLKEYSFNDPFSTITNGFHIHMDYPKDKEKQALTVFDHLLIYLLEEGLRPTSTRLYGPQENGPHVEGGWEVKFETQDKSILKNIGIVIAWLMCNRQGLPVFIHPVTWQEGDHHEELKAHKEYSFFIGHLPKLELNFFQKKINSES